MLELGAGAEYLSWVLELGAGAEYPSWMLELGAGAEYLSWVLERELTPLFLQTSRVVEVSSQGVG